MLQHRITRAAIEEFIAAHPDGVNPMIEDELSNDTSVYFLDNRPFCLFGHIIAAHGGGPGDVQEGFRPPVELFDSEESARLAWLIQPHADAPFTWGVAWTKALADEADPL